MTMLNMGLLRAVRDLDSIRFRTLFITSLHYCRALYTDAFGS